MIAMARSEPGVGWARWALLAGMLAAALALVGAAWAWWDRRRIDPWMRQMAQLRRTLATLGVTAHAHDPPRRLAARLRSGLGGAAEPLAALLERLDRQRYAMPGAIRPDPALTRRFRAEARRLKAAGPG